MCTLVAAPGTHPLPTNLLKRQTATQETICIASLQLLPLVRLLFVLPSSVDALHVCSQPPPPPFTPHSTVTSAVSHQPHHQDASEVHEAKREEQVSGRLVTQHRGGCKQGSWEVEEGEGGGGGKVRGGHWEITQRLQRVNWRVVFTRRTLFFWVCFFFLHPSPDSPPTQRLFTSASINWQLPLLKFHTSTSTFQNVLAQQPR